MVIEDNKTYQIYKKHEKIINTIIGISIVLLLILIWVSYFQHIQLEKQIKENCGWAEEDYECYCKKSEAIALKNELENKYDFVIDDVDT